MKKKRRETSELAGVGLGFGETTLGMKMSKGTVQMLCSSKY